MTYIEKTELGFWTPNKPAQKPSKKASKLAKRFEAIRARIAQSHNPYN